MPPLQTPFAAGQPLPVIEQPQLQQMQPAYPARTYEALEAPPPITEISAQEAALLAMGAAREAVAEAHRRQPQPEIPEHLKPISHDY